jgi:hypothetical protein
MTMSPKLLSAAVALAAVITMAQPAKAQFGPGYTDLGPTLGLGNIGSASLSIGGRFEHGIKTLPDLGNGTLSFELGAQYYHWNCGALGYSCGVTYVPFGATANYHFKLQSAPKFDPFFGLGLGYEYVTCNYGGPGSCGYAGAIYFIGRVGGRYFFAPKMALYADAGAGGAALNVGLMFALKSAQGH